MLDVCPAPAAQAAPQRPVSPAIELPPGRLQPYPGPERRRGTAALARLMMQMLDEVDYGLLLLGDNHRVLHANHAARAGLAAPLHPLQLVGHELRARLAKDVLPLHQALEAAASRGLRRLLTLGEGPQRAGAAIVPLGAGPGGSSATLMVLGRREVCGGLSVHGFAREHRLSPSEELVLGSLCEGCCPNEIARRHGVKIATVRTQIANIRAKTGTDSIRDLVQLVAVLPPMVGALRRQTGFDEVERWLS
jgi:DNA-binding CsgD family transcriptional regulator